MGTTPATDLTPTKARPSPDGAGAGGRSAGGSPVRATDRDELITEVVDVLQDLIDTVSSVVDLSPGTEVLDRLDHLGPGPPGEDDWAGRVGRLAECQRRLADAVAALQGLVGDLDAGTGAARSERLAASGE